MRDSECHFKPLAENYWVNNILADFILLIKTTTMFHLYFLQRMWLDILDETKRKKAALDSQRKEAAQQAALDRKSSSLDPSNREYKYPTNHDYKYPPSCTEKYK